MPIRFRCAYCNQLLGIARRKAGQVVRCPTCAGQVVVPSPEEAGEEANAEAGAPSVPSPPVFERSDFDELFQAPAAPEPPAPLPATEGPLRGSGAYPVESFEPPPRPPPSEPPAPAAHHPGGLVLSPAKATALTVAAILLIALAFGIGLFVGLSLNRGAPATGPASAPAGARGPGAAARAPAARPVEQLVQGRHVQRGGPDQGDGGGPQAEGQRAGAEGDDPRVAAGVEVQQRRPDRAAGRAHG